MHVLCLNGTFHRNCLNK